MHCRARDWFQKAMACAPPAAEGNVAEGDDAKVRPALAAYLSRFSYDTLHTAHGWSSFKPAVALSSHM